MASWPDLFSKAVESPTSLWGHCSTTKTSERINSWSLKSWRGPVFEIIAVLGLGVRVSFKLPVTELRSNLGSLPEKSTRKTGTRHAQGSKGQSHTRSDGKG